MLMTAKRHLSLRALRNLILVVLVVGTTGYTFVMFSAAERLSERFGPQVRADLEWRALRGAQELARACDVGLVLGDAEVLRKCFGAYAQASDVEAIVAVNASNEPVATHGRPPEAVSDLFHGAEQALRSEPTHLVSWATSSIEGTQVGRVALVVSTKRLADAHALLERSSNMALFGGLSALLIGVVVVSFYTRAVARRDAQLSEYATNLEKMVDERTRELDERNRGMRLVLDNVAQGFITVDLQGVMAKERSAIIDSWFGVPDADATFAQFIERHAPQFAASFELNLMQLVEGFLPAELALAQLPGRLSANGRTFDVTYTPVTKGDAIERLLIIVSDVTAQLARERAEREQRELVAIFQRILVDRSSVEEFLADGTKLVRGLETESERLVQRRLVHTLKGNAAMYGLGSLAELAHEVESAMLENDAALSDAQRCLLQGCWREVMVRVESLLGSARKGRVEIERDELEALIERARGGSPHQDLLRQLESWRREPVERRLEQLGRQAAGLARRLGKAEPTIVVEARAVRLDGAPWASYWSAMVHAVRNAVDHGLESPEEREAAAKPRAGRLTLGASTEGPRLTIWLEDDGRGIDWQRVRAKAEAAGLPHATHDDLVEALFADGLSTRDVATDVSGRGVGLAALRQAVHERSGSIRVDSRPGQGTRLSFVFEQGSLETNGTPRSTLEWRGVAQLSSAS